LILLVGVLALTGTILYRIESRVSVPILAYHRINNTLDPMTVKPEDFETQLQYLQNEGYTSVTLDEAIAFMQGTGTLPPKPIVITFDDGYEDNQRIAVPILRKYGFKAIIFVITDNIGKPDYLTWQQLKTVQERAISIGSHTMTHADLAKLQSAEIAQEVRNSKESLEKGLGTAADFIAYPYGSYNQRVVNTLLETGYKGACSGKVGINIRGGDIYALRRIYISPPHLGLLEFKLRLWRAQLVSVFS